MKAAAKIGVLAALVWLTPSWAQNNPTSTLQSAGTLSTTPPDPSSSTAPSLVIEPAPSNGTSAPALTPEWLGVKADIKATAETIARLTTEQRQKWDSAVAALPSFCHEWESLLHDREVENLTHLIWKEHDGYETSTYTGYGKVRGCEAKESTEGVPIGKVTYDEKNYYLVGKSIDEAKSHPKLLGTTNTLEIFSWEKDRWFY